MDIDNMMQICKIALCEELPGVCNEDFALDSCESRDGTRYLDYERNGKRVIITFTEQ